MKKVFITIFLCSAVSWGQFFETEETEEPTEFEKVFQPENKSTQTETEIFEYNLNIERRSEQILQLFNEPENPPYEEPDQGLDEDGDGPPNPSDDEVPIDQWTTFLLLAGLMLGGFYTLRLRP